MSDLKNIKLSIVVSEFNNIITDSLKKAAVDYFIKKGGEKKKVEIFSVPGAYEIPGMVSQIIKKNNVDIIVALGCVIKGETPHFDYISTEVSRAIMQMIVKHDIPIGFGVLTTHTLEQAISRSKPDSSNKGREAMDAALEMYELYKKNNL